MKILFVGAEVAPFVSVGGLSQVSYFLPRALIKRGVDVRIFTAKYGAMDEVSTKFKLEKFIDKIQIPLAQQISDKKVNKQKYTNARVLQYKKKGEPQTYFIENREYFELRANVFGYKDDHVRFALLSKGVLEALLIMKKKGLNREWWPDLIHVNDWHTAYFIDLARNDLRYRELLENIPIVFTVHNFSYQGNMNFRYLAEKDRDFGRGPLARIDSPKLFRQNPLLRGLLYADEINTVSPTHAIEVLTPEYAEGLDDTLNKVRGKLTGILNGLDTKEFNPETDPLIIKNYSTTSHVSARKINKTNLQKEFGLAEDHDVPIIAVLGRISQQKGWELILEALPHLLSEVENLQIIVLGQGDEHFQNQLEQIKRKFPKQMGLHLQRDFRLPRKIFSGADMVLIPSIFEPGGIVALEALRYGAVPIVRRTGGLNDVVEDFNPNTQKGNGFSFTQKSAWSLYGAIISALTVYKSSTLWNKLVKNCMAQDFSWDHTAVDYEIWYQKALEERRRATSINPAPAYKIQVGK